MITHNDCRHYLPLDVYKGYCRRDGTEILCDDPNCENFEYTPRCKYCLNYSPLDEASGSCSAENEASPEQIACNCINYKAKM
ncbi:MAG: 4-hydroxyphenylacetate decarboxylase small subunit [Bacteroidia bacterium]|nr:4-hydroxyphenylacetate decarboxylase small subunit [Bacteroidia bacterium]